MNVQELERTAQAMVANGRGLLAMDESIPTIGRRLAAVGVENEESNRRAYRELLLGTEGLGEFISGAILHDETIHQKAADGTPLLELARQADIIPGIKVDGGTRPLAGCPGELITEGLDGLRERLAHYRDLGARFCKWRAVITIGPNMPSRLCIETNARVLARYAALCQEADLVPIVEPEVLIEGEHTLERCYEVSVETQHETFAALHRHGVHLPGIVLKPSMVIAGRQCPKRMEADQVGLWTVRCMQNTVPAAVPGIAFLSGGQTDEEATVHLNAMNRLGRQLRLPWELTFSFARALQNEALRTWAGRPERVEDARRVLLHRARCNAAASRGEYRPEMEADRAA